MKLITKALVGIALLSTAGVSAQVRKTATAPTHTIAQKKLSVDEAYLQKHPDIKTFVREPGKVVILEKTDGTFERYSLDGFADEKKYKEKYGDKPPYKTTLTRTPADVHVN